MESNAFSQALNGARQESIIEKRRHHLINIHRFLEQPYTWDVSESGKLKIGDKGYDTYVCRSGVRTALVGYLQGALLDQSICFGQEQKQVFSEAIECLMSIGTPTEPSELDRHRLFRGIIDSAFRNPGGFFAGVPKKKKVDEAMDLYNSFQSLSRQEWNDVVDRLKSFTEPEKATLKYAFLKARQKKEVLATQAEMVKAKGLVQRACFILERPV